MRYFGIFALIATAVAAPLTSRPLDRACPQLQGLWRNIGKNSTLLSNLNTAVDVVRESAVDAVREVCCSDAARKFPGEIDPLCPIDAIQRRNNDYYEFSPRLSGHCSKLAKSHGCTPGYDNDSISCFYTLQQCCKMFGLDPFTGFIPDPICLSYIMIEKLEQANSPPHPPPVKKELFTKRQTLTYQGVVRHDRSYMCTVPYFTELYCCKYDQYDHLKMECNKLDRKTLPHNPEAFKRDCGFRSPACCPIWGGYGCLPVRTSSNVEPITLPNFLLPPNGDGEDGHDAPGGAFVRYENKENITASFEDRW
ncbi:hypothetical protein PtrSN002B_008543 [Pyrenophora tritici-repentis]|uniref:Uncharacterized protein n=1 Tax=Pyrenophora tritici-repentis TaxID=45151 RepID=A0A2W1CXJ2_9PLEO|nr:hypothetical protein PtrV1_13661 [Pyrenophora tritici-repentis]KAF7447313.1 hypothetical protein A1F99_087600 [Pyrenophora tritici-repentis]KAF7569675.1 hypothetical protein PtrM4_120900 [Pyrenophora tritici-repentis]KAG9382593.1 hypothetical protein A1F94_006514 [Pyrenophora tritici-repentis]KAI0572986.1 hypothetical protein Alg215_09460 [Pyrenophora tritici-repentis]